MPEEQKFQLGDTAYMIDDDYRLFESTVYSISLQKGHYSYDTYDCDFYTNDIGDWVFETKKDREIHLESLFADK